MGDVSVPDSWWPGGIAIWENVDANPQPFHIPGSNISFPTNWTSDAAPPGWQYMYAVDNATAHPIAVIGEVGYSFHD
jgi:hypothetical protein